MVEPTLADAVHWHQAGKRLAPSAQSVKFTDVLVQELLRARDIANGLLENTEPYQNDIVEAMNERLAPLEVFRG